MILTDFLASNSYIITNKLLIRNCRNRCYNYIRRVTFRIQLLGKTGQLTNEECFFSTRKNIEHNTGLSEHKQRIAIKRTIIKNICKTLFIKIINLIIQWIQSEIINQTMSKEFIQKDFLISFMLILNNYYIKSIVYFKCFFISP